MAGSQTSATGLVAESSRDGQGGSKAHLRGASLAQKFSEVRAQSELLCESLENEDFVVQSMPDASPVKWHLAHTTWFFETFILEEAAGEYAVFHPAYRTVFNSYYNGVGEQFTREKRGTLSRPTVKDIRGYRAHVDAGMQAVFANAEDTARFAERIEIGLHHEQQHQELLLTDLKHGLGQWAGPTAPLGKPYAARALPLASPPRGGWLDVEGGVVDIGHDAAQGFAFDCEMPTHRFFLDPFRIAKDVVRCGAYRAFMKDGGYTSPDLWLSDGWTWLNDNRVTAPLYWAEDSSSLTGFSHFTLHGWLPVDDNAPVTHVSFFEADAFARWSGARLPTEEEWEHAAATLNHANGTFLESNLRHPIGPQGKIDDDVASGMLGDVWEWTASAYRPYPGFASLPGALGEYNGKFMSGQMVLRGGSVATPQAHIRSTYRNFFQPEKRWQFTGIRLAEKKA